MLYLFRENRQLLTQVNKYVFNYLLRMSETIISIGESVTAHLFNYVLLSVSYYISFEG